MDLPGPVAVVVAAVEVHDADADPAPSLRRPRARLGSRQGEGEVRADLVGRRVHAHRPHRLAGLLVAVRAVRGQPRRPAHQGPGRPAADRGGAHTGQRDPRAQQPAARAEQEQRVREPPRPQRQRGLQHAHARHDHHVVPAHPGGRAEGVDDLPEPLPGDRARAGGGPVLAAVPVQPRRRDAVPGRDGFGPAAQRVHRRLRVRGAQIPEDGLQRPVVAEVAGAQQPEHPDADGPHGCLSVRRTRPSRPATSESTETASRSGTSGARSSTRSPAPGRARLASHAARWR